MEQGQCSQRIHLDDGIADRAGQLSRLLERDFPLCVMRRADLRRAEGRQRFCFARDVTGRCGQGDGLLQQWNGEIGASLLR